MAVVEMVPPEDGQLPVLPVQLELEAAEALGADDVGGKRATEATLTLSGTVKVRGSFRKGERLLLVVTADVSQVAFTDQFDKETGQVVSSRRSHKAKLVDVTFAPED